MTKEKKQFYFAVGIIFLTIYILNHFTLRSAGDDYVYSFMWEGHSMYEPLSEDARRIASFSDIAKSTWLYFFTWGGRVIAQAMAMFFLWMPRDVFTVFISATAVLLVFLIQWIARGGRVTREIPAKDLLFSAFCLWTLEANFVGVFIWLDGSCNYLWPMVFLLAFLLPYVRHYLEGAWEYKSYLTPLMFFLGLLAGNGNENTICWIGLFGFFYLISLYRKGELAPWMLSGFIGLSIGYGILMLSPGNFARMEGSKETFDFFRADNKAFVAIWLYILISSYPYFYLLKSLRRRKEFKAFDFAKKYLHLSGWFAMASLLFALIMYFSPEFPLRSLFPSTVFCLVAVFVMHELEKKTGIYLTPAGVRKNIKRVAALYFVCTFSITLWCYVGNFYWFQEWEQQLKAMNGSDAVLEITDRPPYEEMKWIYLTGLHLYTVGIKEDTDHWGNVAMARFYGIGGVKMAGKSE